MFLLATTLNEFFGVLISLKDRSRDRGTKEALSSVPRGCSAVQALTDARLFRKVSSALKICIHSSLSKLSPLLWLSKFSKEKDGATWRGMVVFEFYSKELI